MSEEQKAQVQGELKLPSAQELLEAGVHFGHKKSRWHPKMEKYIFGVRNDVHIFDLDKTLDKLGEALVFLREVLSRDGSILFVGTKPAAKNFIKTAAQELGMAYVSERWLGGTLTNFKTITKRLQYLKDLEDGEKSGAWEKYTKKEKLELSRTMVKLNKRLEGIKNLTRLPDALLIADVKTDNLAVREAKRMKIPVVAICDSNVDPSLIDYPIPANDDASTSLNIMMSAMVQNLKDVKPTKLQKGAGEEEKNSNFELK